MKKTLDTLLDEATAKEIAPLVEQTTAPKISADTLASIKQKVYTKTGLAPVQKKKSLPVRWYSYVAMAACIVLLIGMGIFLPLLGKDHPAPSQPVTPLPQEEISYTISMKNGICYLNFSDGNDSTPSNSNISGTWLADLEFSSLGEMKDAFLNHRLKEYQINTMKEVFEEDENGIIIPDMNHLYEPSLPDNLTTYSCLNIILSSSACYGFELYAPSVDPTSVEALDYTYGYFSIVSQERFDKLYSDKLSFLDGIWGSQTQVEDRNATAYRYYTHSGGFIVMTYDILVGDKTLRIIEEYTTAWYGHESSLTQPVSDSVPHTVRIYGSANGQFFEIALSKFEERPSIEWLSSFGVTEYTDEATLTD